MTRTRTWIAGAAVAVVAALVAAIVVHVSGPDEPGVRASSTGTGAAVDLPGAVSEARDEPPADRTTVWGSDGAAEGSWLQFTWPSATTVDHITVLAPSDPDQALRSGMLVFSDGSTLMVSATAESPDIDVDFPARDVTGARLVVAEGGVDDAGTVALAGAALDDSAEVEVPAQTSGEPAVTVSSGGGAEALTDPGPASAGGGGEWTADPQDAEPWVEFRWETPREVSAVQVVGPSATAFDPANSAASELYGSVDFPDGSSVLVSGIDGGDPQTTTVAFTPRVTDVVRLSLSPAVDGAEVGLRRLAVFSPGQVPPPPDLPPTVDPLDVPEAGTCDTSSDPVGTASDGALALVCPAPGTAVAGTWDVVVSGRPNTPLAAQTWTAAGGSDVGAVTTVTTSTTDADGLAVLTFTSADLPRGPVNIRVSDAMTGSPVAGTDRAADVVVQVVNTEGQPSTTGGHAPAGMTLQYDEEFQDGLSVDRSGESAAYAATRPAYWGTSEFGDAVFVDPSTSAENAQNLGIVDADYLRIRADALGSRRVPTPYGQEHASALLSSLRVGAGGFSAQYGYFEARILGAPGEGTWPAFWMMDTESATQRTPDGGEIDAVELYGHNPAGSCHSTHNWTENQDTGAGSDCLEDNGFADWTTSWHTYGVQILPAGAVYYIDGVEVSRSDGLRDHETPYYFMANLALGGGWPVDLAATGETTDMYVDWVRVYT